MIDTLTMAVLPALVLTAYFHARNDGGTARSLLWGALIMGVLSAFATLPVSRLFQGLLAPSDDIYANAFGVAFFAAAIPEELVKGGFIVVFATAHGKKIRPHDLVVAAAAVGAGFAGHENILYLFRAFDDWQTVGAMRALISVPGHVFVGAIMGACLALGEMTGSKGWWAAALALPVLTHGLFDFPLFVASFAGEVDDPEQIGEVALIAAGIVILVEAVAALAASFAVQALEEQQGLAPETPPSASQDLLLGAGLVVAGLAIAIGGLSMVATLVESEGLPIFFAIFPVAYAAASLKLGYVRLTAPVKGED